MEGAFILSELITGAQSIVTGVVAMLPDWLGFFTSNSALMYPFYAGLALLGLKIVSKAKA